MDLQKNETGFIPKMVAALQCATTCNVGKFFCHVIDSLLTRRCANVRLRAAATDITTARQPPLQSIARDDRYRANAYTLS
ncbi:hypothetical protein [Paraburkholderia unamae]|uniref:hypothetical protein n=1 Tax=Paraburkholderia unamae TaxID=219649 RepID=UPI001CC4B3E8|nr:hypothetical protein [Paraburkholderia unamae]